jgi:hypothetical protein
MVEQVFTARDEEKGNGKERMKRLFTKKDKGKEMEGGERVDT